MGIQPCCIDKKLPPLIYDGGECSFFFSYGDWGLEKLWTAVSHLVPSDYDLDPESKAVTGCNVFTLITLPTVDVYTLRFIRNHLSHHWIHALALIISDTGKEEIVRSELKGFEDRLWYCEGRREAADSNLWIRSTVQQTLVVAGPIHHGNGDGRFCQYTASYSTSSAGAMQAMIPYSRVLRMRALIKGRDPLFDMWINKKKI